MPRLRRLGIFGGAFDPVHLGHLMGAQAAFEALRLDELRFLPTGNPAFKAKTCFSGTQRLAMLKAAVRAWPGFSVDARELKRSGVSYTVDTLRELHSELKGRVELSFILGLDAALGIPKWKEAEKLKNLAKFYVLERPGMPIELRKALLRMRKTWGLAFVAMPQMGISSTLVRQRWQQGKSLRTWVPDAVERLLEKAR